MHLWSHDKIKIERRPEAFSQLTLLGLLAVIAIIFILAFLSALKIQQDKQKSIRIKCVSNLKNVGLSFRMFATDNLDKYPFELSDTSTAQFTQRRDAFRHFLALSNELNTPKLLVCPADPERFDAFTFATLSNSNLSYFVGLSASENLPHSWLSGDRNLEKNRFLLGPGRHILEPGSNLSWSPQIHRFRGNIVMGDGSVQQLTNERMPQAVEDMGDGPIQQLTNEPMPQALENFGQLTNELLIP